RSGRRWLLAGVYGLLLAAIILIGTRAAWIMFGVVTAIYLLVEVREGRGGGRLIAAILAVTTLFATVAYQGSDAFRQRIDRSMLILEGDAKAMDTALSQRLPIWETALAMGSDHWLNGVGVRGFRYAYPDYAASDDPWLNAEDDTGAYHAHQVILELWTETGLIGLLAWLIGAAVAVRAWLRADRTARRAALPYAAGLAAMLFPINSHLAFYSTFWSIVFWWLLALYAGSLGQSGDESPPS
ncbi:MAG: O-antigen ligase family protein, partial [Xanthomonadales bacterium]|nr:O-antigen ligase family protein [Xanthomonadales bacterium]